MSPVSKINIETQKPEVYRFSIPLFELLHAAKKHRGLDTKYDRIKLQLYRAICRMQDEHYTRDKKVIREFCNRKDFFLRSKS